MKQILEKQEKQLNEIKTLSKKDNVVQLAQVALQTKTDKDLKDGQERTNDKLDEIKKTLENGFTKETPKSLNSNVIKLFKEVEKQSKLIKKNQMNPQVAAAVTDKAMKVPQFKQIGERFEGLTKGFKDFFTLKGFLNKTGLVDENSGGIISTAVNKRAARMEYVEDRMKMDRDKLWNLRGGKKLDESLKSGEISQEEFDQKKKELEDGMRESFSKIFNDAQDIMRKMRKNEADIDRMEKAGFTEQQIKSSGAFDTRADLAKQLSERDTRFKVPKDETAEKEKSEGKGPELVVDNTKKTAEPAAFSDEGQLEATRLQERQVGLLERIAENTEYLKNLGGGGTAKREREEEEGGGLGLTDLIPGRGILSGIRRAGRGLARGAKALVRGAGKAALGVARFAGTPMGMRLGGALAVAGGAYTAYKGWTGAEEEKQAELAKLEEAKQSGQISEEDYAAQKTQIEEKTVEKKGGAVGEGTGMAAGAIGGAKLGATIGTFIGGPIGTGVGALAGGAIGAFAGSKAGKVVGEYGGKAVNVGKRAFTALGEKVRGFAGQVKDSWNRGTGGTMAAQEMDTEVAKRMKAEGVEFGSKRANEIREEVRKEILAKDPNAFRLADQRVGSVSTVNENQTSGQGMVTTEQNQAQGITSKKSLFGSEFLGSLVSKKGLQTGSFSGTSSEQKSIESTTDSMMSSADNTTSKFRELFGERISGGLFGKDKYKVSAGDGIDTEISKDQYMKMQALVAKGDPESQKKASAMLEDIRKKSAEAKMFEGAYDISKSPEEMVTPMTQKASAGPSMMDRVRSFFKPKEALPGTSAAEMINTGAVAAPMPTKSSSGIFSNLAEKAKSFFSFGKAEQPKVIAPVATPAAPVLASVPTMTKAVSAPPPSPVFDASLNNKRLADRVAEKPPQPVIVNAPTTNVANNKQSILMPTNIRNEDSSVDSYMRKRSFAA